MQSEKYEVQICVQVFILHFVFLTLHFARCFNTSRRSKILNDCRTEQPSSGTSFTVFVWPGVADAGEAGFGETRPREDNESGNEFPHSKGR